MTNGNLYIATVGRDHELGPSLRNPKPVTRMTTVIQIHVHADPAPRPVASYAETWNASAATVNRWARCGKIPGAFRGPDGSWWVKPLMLWNWEPPTDDHDETETTPEGDGVDHALKGEVVLEDKAEWFKRAKRPVRHA